MAAPDLKLQPRILHLDDEPVDGELVAHELKRQKFRCARTFVQTKAEFLSALERKDFDVILSDYRMPGFDGDQALKAAREKCPEIPFIMVTGELGEILAIETLKRGATDYVLKDNLQRLVPAIERALEEARNMRIHTAAEHLLWEQHQELQAIQRMMTSISQVERLDQIYDQVFDVLGDSLNIRRAAILLFDDDGKMRFTAWRNLSEKYRSAVDGHSPWLPGETHVQSILISDTALEPGMEAFYEIMHREGIHAIGFVPLVYRHRLLGKYMVYYSSPHHFTDRDRQLLEMISTHVALAIGRTQGEEAMRRSEQRFRDLIHALPVALYTTDAVGRVTMFNDAAAALWGRRPELGKDMWCGAWKIYDRDGSPISLENNPMALAVREGPPARNQEIIIERPDGTRAHVIASPTPLRNESGDVTGAVNMLVDLTGQQRDEMAQAHLAAIVRSSDDAIISEDLDGKITSWNKAAERIFGYPANEIIGRPVTVITPPDRQNEETAIIECLRRGERVNHFDTIRMAKDGRYIPVSLTISPVKDENGSLTGISRIARDSTGR